MYGGKICLLVLFLLVLPMSYAVTINPSQYTIKEPETNEKYNIVITVINPDVTSFGVNALVSEESSYLEPYVSLDPTFVQMEPNERKNIRLTLEIAENIPPGEHELKIDFMALNQRLASFNLDFEIEGTRSHNVVLKDVFVNAIDTETPVYFNLHTINDGNVLENVLPVLEIYKDENLVKNINQTGAFRMMPGDENNLSLMFDPSEIKEGGAYSYNAYLRYSNETTDEIKGSFNLKKVEKERGKRVYSIDEGDKFELPVYLENPGSGLTFYKISAKIPDENISNVIEGSFEDASRKVYVDLPTEELISGDYDLNVEISRGREFETVEKSQYILKVERGFSGLLITLGIPIAVITILIIIVLIYGYKNSIALKASGLNKKINKIDKGFNQIEEDIKKINADVQNFITESNEWLGKYGKGFK